MNETDYWKGFIVGAVSILTLLTPLIVIVTAISLLPSFYRETAIITFAFILIFTLRRLIYRFERFWKRRINLEEKHDILEKEVK